MFYLKNTEVRKNVCANLRTNSRMCRVSKQLALIWKKKTGSIENCRYTEHLSTSNVLEQNKKQSQAVFKIVTKH